ncbi:MAG: DNA repair protein RecO [Bacteroidaceae bacterium]|nr:DNA repair protein RecO [Bacteroidaceae bacterium]
MLQKTKALVLHTIKYNDSSLIVHAYTEMYGRLAFWVRIPKSHKAKVRNVLFQPLSLLDLDVDLSSKNGIHHIKDAKPVVVWQSIPFHPVKSSIAMFISEFLSKALMEQAENKPLFAYLEASTEWLDNCERPAANFHLVFLMHLALFLGLYPNLDNYHDGDWFDLQSGTFEPLPPLHKQCVKPVEASRICTLMRMNYENMHLFNLSHFDRGQILDVLLSYYAIHITGTSELKSLSVLKELFA